ncbi:hypothetical protein BDV28DRAFT_133232 [Aspergillus coremiiformis]|uniref:Uncharacterized protein n=1 Tax=Aspergillus coremiiformis TaxID=138285 RepID=A0A5N6Z9I8_9EURO|nr:hypothetical protein BDV28DRAFT_133232 [Aspergillus coremiiformis]
MQFGARECSRLILGWEQNHRRRIQYIGHSPKIKNLPAQTYPLQIPSRQPQATASFARSAQLPRTGPGLKRQFTLTMPTTCFVVFILTSRALHGCAFFSHSLSPSHWYMAVLPGALAPRPRPRCSIWHEFTPPSILPCESMVQYPVSMISS